MSNYHSLHCVTCGERTDEPMRPNWGVEDLQRVLDHAPQLVRMADWCQEHGIDVEFSLLYLPSIDTRWLRKHLGHDVHVCGEYRGECPSPHVLAKDRCKACRAGGYDANGAPSWDGNGAPV